MKDLVLIFTTCMWRHFQSRAIFILGTSKIVATNLSSRKESDINMDKCVEKHCMTHVQKLVFTNS